MSFVFPLILGGLALAGIPVLVHLIRRQQPKQLLFPAFRFLLERHRTNQRKLQLRHILLLSLRILLIVAICLALSRPKLFSERLSLSAERPVAAVLLFDTSASMQYSVKGESRLDAAKRRARELLDLLPDGSRIAVLDTAEPGGEWLPNLALARERVAERAIRPANNPVTSRLAEAYRLLNELDSEPGEQEQSLPRFLYVFSDRTSESWDASRLKDLQALRQRLATQTREIFVDVGVENPVDVALTALELPRHTVPVDDNVVLRATVRSTGADCEAVVACRIDGEKAADQKSIKLQREQPQVVTFERRNLTIGSHQAEITLTASDSLPLNNALFASFDVRGARKILILTDDPADAYFIEVALKLLKGFQCEVRRTTETLRFGPDDFAKYKAVCLLNVARPGRNLWEMLNRYVSGGGGLAIVPGGEDTDVSAYNEGDASQALMPGRLLRIVQAKPPDGVSWSEATYKHPLLAPFREWSQSGNINFVKLPPRAFRYWEVEAYPQDSFKIAAYSDKESRPALLERNFDRRQVKGRAILFTTAMGAGQLSSSKPWNDYLKTAFFLVLTDKALGYLAGQTDESGANYQSGQAVTVIVPPTSRASTYALHGPELTASQRTVQRGEGRTEITLTSPATPGNYVLVDPDNKTVGTFSVNLPSGESDLGRVPKEQIEGLFGPGAVLALDFGTNLQEALQGHWSQPIELLPWLMMALLVGLALENLLANDFYMRDDENPIPGVILVYGMIIMVASAIGIGVGTLLLLPALTQTVTPLTLAYDGFVIGLSVACFRLGKGLRRGERQAVYGIGIISGLALIGSIALFVGGQVSEGLSLFFVAFLLCAPPLLSAFRHWAVLK